MQQRAHARPSSLRPLCLAIGLASVGGAAWAADESPYYIGASQTFTRDSNLFRQPEGSGLVVHDYYSSTGLLGGLDTRLGRQRVYLNGTAQANRYHNERQLNNTSYSLSTGLDWETVERLSGTLRYDDSQSLANYGATDLQDIITVKDVQTVRQASATARYGVGARVGIDGSVAHRSIKFSAALDRRGYTENVGSLGVSWGTAGVLTLGTAYRVTKTDSPSALITPKILILPIPLPPAVPAFIPPVYAPDKVDRRDIDFTAIWAATGLSTINARLSATHQTHSASLPTFSGLTGAVIWDYKPTGKLTFKTSLTRDTGTETAFTSGYLLNETPTPVQSNRINTIIGVDAAWEATAKIRVIGGVRHSNSKQAAGGGSSSDSASQYSLGVNYLPTRTISLGCNLAHETHSGIYTDNIASCTAQITFR